MSNNKFIFQEQQKMAIKLNNCLEMTQAEFTQHVTNNNQKLKEAFDKNPSYNYSPILPKPDTIYEREFHFMDETLLAKEKRIQRKRERKQLKKKQREEQKTLDEQTENELQQIKN